MCTIAFYAAGETEDGGRGGARRDPLTPNKVTDHRSGECEEIKNWDKISDMKLNSSKQLIVGPLVMESHLDITFRLLYL